MIDCVQLHAQIAWHSLGVAEQILPSVSSDHRAVVSDKNNPRTAEECSATDRLGPRGSRIFRVDHHRRRGHRVRQWSMTCRAKSPKPRVQLTLSRLRKASRN